MGRLEIPATQNHWETAFVAPVVSLARGWERQVDIADNPMFYEEVNYAASCAFDRVSGDEDAFWDALKERGPRVSVELMGEDFDFDDDQEMRRRHRLVARRRAGRTNASRSPCWPTF